MKRDTFVGSAQSLGREHAYSGTGRSIPATELDQIIQYNASASEELASMSEELSSQAEQLQTTVAFFKIDAAAAEAPPRQLTDSRRSHRRESVPAVTQEQGFAVV